MDEPFPPSVPAATMGGTTERRPTRRPHGRRDHHHRGRQPHRRPRAALHAVGRRGRQLLGGLDPAQLRQEHQRVGRRRGDVPALLHLAAGRGERRRVAAAGHAGRRPGPAQGPHLRDPRGREAHRLRDRGRRDRPVAEVRDRQGQPHQPPGRRGRLLRRWRRSGRWPGGRRPVRPAAADPWATPAPAAGGGAGACRRSRAGRQRPVGRPRRLRPTSLRSDPTSTTRHTPIDHSGLSVAFWQGPGF